MVTRGLDIRRAIGHGLLAVALVVAVSAPSAAQDSEGTAFGAPATPVKKLGGSTRFSRPMRSVEELRSMAIANRAHFARIFSMTGLGALSEPVLDALVMGNVTETTVAPGTRMSWMALKRSGIPDVLRNIQWAGREAFAAWRISVVDRGINYTFVVPKICGNMSLLSAEAVPTVAVARPAPAPEPPPAAPEPAPEPQAAVPPPSSPPPAAAPPAAHDDTQRWMATGFIGGHFATDLDTEIDNETDDSVTWGAQLSYAWHSFVGPELLVEFAPNVGISDVGAAFSDQPAVNSYMANVIGQLPFKAGNFSPYVSGGFGAIHMRTEIIPAPLLSDAVESNHETAFGSNFGFGLVAFMGRLGLRTDVRYYHAATNDAVNFDNSLAETRTEGLLSGLHYWRANLGLSVRW